MLNGKLFTLSGIDGAGKSTQIDLLMQSVAIIGKKPVYLWTRGGYTGPFNFLKTCLRKVLGKKLPPSGRNSSREKAFQKFWIRNLWLNLAIFDLIVVYGFYVRWLRLLGRYIIADRYISDTWIDFKLNFPEVNYDKWYLWKILIWLTPEPDKSFVLLIPVAESLRRSEMKNEPFPDSKEVLEKRLELYQSFAPASDCYTIDCLQPIPKIHREILQKTAL
jgi:thymidylate kinase